jgi:hypothetical protein
MASVHIAKTLRDAADYIEELEWEIAMLRNANKALMNDPKWITVENEEDVFKRLDLAIQDQHPNWERDAYTKLAQTLYGDK